MGSPKTPPCRAGVIAARLITAVVSLAGAEGMLGFMNYPNWWAMDQGTGGGMAGVECDPQLGWKLKEGDYKLVWAEHLDPNHPFRHPNGRQGRRATA